MDFYENVNNKANHYLIEMNIKELNENQIKNIIHDTTDTLDVYFLMLQLNNHGVDVHKLSNNIQIVTMFHKLMSIENTEVLENILKSYPDQKLTESNDKMLNKVISYLTELPLDTSIPIQFTNIRNNNDLTVDLYEIANYLNMYDVRQEYLNITLNELPEPVMDTTTELNTEQTTISMISQMFDIEMSNVYLPKYNYTFSKLLELVVINNIISICCRCEIDFDIENFNTSNLDPLTLQFQVYTFLELMRQNSKIQQQILNILLKIATKLDITQPAIEINKYKQLFWDIIKLVESGVDNVDEGIFNIFINGNYMLPIIDIQMLINKSIVLSNKLCITITKDQISNYIYYYKNLTPNLYYDNEKLICWDQFKIFLKIFKHRGRDTLEIDNRNYIHFRKNPLAIQNPYDLIDIENTTILFDNLVAKLNFSYPYDFTSTLIKMINFNKEEIESLFISKIYKTNNSNYNELWFKNYFVLAVLHNYYCNIFCFNTQQMYRYVQVMNTHDFQITPMLSLLYYQVNFDRFESDSIITRLPDIIQSIISNSKDEFELFYHCKNYTVPELEIIIYLNNNSTKNMSPIEIIILTLLIQNNTMISTVEQKYLSLIIDYYLHQVVYTPYSASSQKTITSNSKQNDIIIQQQTLLPINGNVPDYYANLVQQNIKIEPDIEYLAKIIPKSNNLQFYRNLIKFYN